MALKLTLTDDEVAEVRLQLGARLTTADISDDQIKSDSMLGVASLYCTFRLFSLVSDSDKMEPGALRNLTDGTSDNLDTYLSGLPSRMARVIELFRNAVIYRTAGHCVVALRVVTAEVAGGISQRQQVSPVELRQAALWSQADLLLNQIVDALPNDDFTESGAPADYLERWRTLFTLATPR